jgi:predicted nucleic acid-binding protein
MKRHVIADAGPLIALARLERLDLLQRLFGTVLVTGWVADEVLAGGDFPVELQDLTNPDSQAQCRDLMNLHQIDMGEASAMVLAQHLASQGDAAMLLMDDFRGRSAAQHSGFSLIGTTGLLLLGKQVGAIVAVKPCLLALREHGYFLSDRLIASALEQAGEN